MGTRNNWKKTTKKFGKLKLKRLKSRLALGQQMERGIKNPKTRAEDKYGV